MRAGKKPEPGLRVIFAVEGNDERSVFSAHMAAVSPGCELFFPSNISDVQGLYSNDMADAIITDLRFHSGALADWLTFWPLPCVLLVDPGEDLDRIEIIIRDEAALFIHRMPGFAHIPALPLLVRKALNIRESTARQNAHLQMSEHQYLNLLQAIPDIVYTLDGEGRFRYLNDAVRGLGYEPSALIGKHFSEIIHPDDVPRVSRIEAEKALPEQGGAPKLFDERRSGKRMTRNLELRLRRGSLNSDYYLGSVTSYGEVNCSGFDLPEFEGAAQGTLGIIRDVTARREHEEHLESTLAAREILLRETHHRVKNNLQVVSSLLNIQESALENPEARKVFLECQTQIQTMSMVHEALYRSASLESVNMQSYFEVLIEYLLTVYDATARGIRCEIQSPGIALSLDDAIPVALVVNELVSNCMKHAFPSGAGGLIHVSMREAASSSGADDRDSWLLQIGDDGVGLGCAPSSAAKRKVSGIGTELVQALSAQVRGSVKRSPGLEGRGTLVSILFSKI